MQRKDRVTVFTPKIGKIAKTFGKRSVEAAIIGSYKESLSGISFGDVVYLDRGRADGVELGNIFEVYSFVDRGTDKKITPSLTCADDVISFKSVFKLLFRRLAIYLFGE